MILVSACLAGIHCKWNGGTNFCPKILDLVRSGKAIPVCPEQLGGMTTPRAPAEQQQNKVCTKDGVDVTDHFEKGAHETLRLAQSVGCKKAILKSRSPSCGCGNVYDGTFSGKLCKGDGVTVQLLKKNGIVVLTEEEFFHSSDTLETK